MVKSNLDRSILYPNVRHIYAEDNKKKVCLYEIVSFDLIFLVAVGEIRDCYKEKNILYCPIYLVRPNNKVIQIGVFEFTKSNYDKYIDYDLDYNFDEPLLYDFVNKDFLIKNGKIKHEDEDEDEDKDEDEDEDEIIKEIPLHRKDIFTQKPASRKKINIPVETELEAKHEREKYREKKEDTWISKWLKNKNYSIINIDNNGDCLFSCLKQAFDQINEETTTNQIRKKLCNKVNEDLFNQYRLNFDLFTDEIKKTSVESIKMKKQNEQLK